MMVLEEVKAFDELLIDRTLSPEDLTLWAKFRFSLYLAVGVQSTFIAEA